MANASEGPPLKRFKLVGVLGVLAISLLGTLFRLATGWPEWITYGVPLVVLILVTLPLLRAAQRQQAERRNAQSNSEHAA
jgi:di/tricarboxylate transporter